MIIGIGGVSNAGKSTLAKKIRELYSGKKVRILCQDDFVKPHYELPKIHEHIDWEVPESIDFAFYKSQIISASKTCDIVIAEGLFAFWDKSLSALYDKKIFVNISEKTFRERKKRDLRWGKEPQWYIDHIWNSYLKYGKIEQGLHNFLYLSGEKEYSGSKILSFLNRNDG
jgi:uridine kinase